VKKLSRFFPLRKFKIFKRSSFLSQIRSGMSILILPIFFSVSGTAYLAILYVIPKSAKVVMTFHGKSLKRLKNKKCRSKKLRIKKKFQPWLILSLSFGKLSTFGKFSTFVNKLGRCEK